MDAYVATWDVAAVAEPLAREALRWFRRTGDAAGMSKAWETLSDVDWMLARYGRCGENAQRALALAEQSGDPRRPIRIMASLAMADDFGPLPLDRAEDRIRGLVRATAGHPEAQAQLKAFYALALAHRGRTREARRIQSEVDGTLAGLGLEYKQAEMSTAAGQVEALAGQWHQAERAFAAAAEGLARLGDANLVVTTWAHQGDAALQQGRPVEAAILARRCLRHARANDVESQVRGRATLAVAMLAASNSTAAPRQLLEEAWALLTPRQAPFLAWELSMAMGSICQADGDLQGASRAFSRAAAIAGRKGSSVLSARARGAAGKVRTARR